MLNLKIQKSSIVLTKQWPTYSFHGPLHWGARRNSKHLSATGTSRRISILNWVLKLNHVFGYLFVYLMSLYFICHKKHLRQWNSGIKWCSNCCNCFNIFMTPVPSIQVKYQTQRDIFSCFKSFFAANALQFLICFSRE